MLEAALGCAVPLWIAKLKQQPHDVILARAQVLATTVASTADNVLYRSKKKGETAKAFNALAEAIAVLSFCPGGITFRGLHFEAQHPDGG